MVHDNNFVTKLFQQCKLENGVARFLESGDGVSINRQAVIGSDLTKAKYSSFQRQMNLYGFYNSNKGGDKNMWIHDGGDFNVNTDLSLITRKGKSPTSANGGRERRMRKWSSATEVENSMPGEYAPEKRKRVILSTSTTTRVLKPTARRSPKGFTLFKTGGLGKLFGKKSPRSRSSTPGLDYEEIEPSAEAKAEGVGFLEGITSLQVDIVNYVHLMQDSLLSQDGKEVPAFNAEKEEGLVDASTILAVQGMFQLNQPFHFEDYEEVVQLKSGDDSGPSLNNVDENALSDVMTLFDGWALDVTHENAPKDDKEKHVEQLLHTMNCM